MIKGNLGLLKAGDEFPTRVIGVINLSVASFYQQSVVSSAADIEQIARKMIEEGADGLDVGAQSTRPIQIYGGEIRVDQDTELSLVKNATSTILDIFSSYDNKELSIDTTRSTVAEYALNQGIKIINDISGLKKDNKMSDIIADYDACAVLMAARKEPGDVYRINDIIKELQASIEIGVNAGIKEENIILDPGIGSWEARDYRHDYNIIKNLTEFRVLNRPIYVGISRKTSIGKVLNDSPPEERLYGSIGATIIALANGVHVVRTHDVKPTIEAIRVAETILNFKDL